MQQRQVGSDFRRGTDLQLATQLDILVQPPNVRPRPCEDLKTGEFTFPDTDFPPGGCKRVHGWEGMRPKILSDRLIFV